MKYEVILLLRDHGVSVSHLIRIAEELRKALSVDVAPVIEAYQPSLSSFDFEKNCYDKHKLISDVSSRLSMNKPFLLLSNLIGIYGYETAFCDLKTKGCLARTTDTEEIKKLVELLL